MINDYYYFYFFVLCGRPINTKAIINLKNKLFSWLIPFEMYREGCEDYGCFPFVRTDWAHHFQCKVKFTFNPNYWARLVKSFNSMHRGDAFSAKTLGKSFFLVSK